MTHEQESTTEDNSSPGGKTSAEATYASARNDATKAYKSVKVGTRPQLNPPTEAIVREKLEDMIEQTQTLVGKPIELKNSEFEKLRKLIYERIGICLNDSKKALVSGRLQRILRQKGFSSFQQYYEYIEKNEDETALAEFTSRITTNHTYFNREADHFDYFDSIVFPGIIEKVKEQDSKDIRIWCAGCSTGEEAYMLMMLMMENLGPDYFDYDAGLLATDISEKALATAVRGLYTKDRLSTLPSKLRTKYFHKEVEGIFRASDLLRKEILFRKFNLISEQFPFKKPFHIIFCRNVMIYFDQPTRDKLVSRFHEFPRARRVPVHRSFRIAQAARQVAPVQLHQARRLQEEPMKKIIKVLIVDDSAFVRQVLSQGLSEDPNIDIIGTASDPYEARDKMVLKKPDVMTLDIEMPRMDGVEFLKAFMPQYPIPVVVVSALTEKGKRITLDALEAGAVDYVLKPKANLKDGLNSMLMELRTKIKIASTANVAHWKYKKQTAPHIARGSLKETTDKVIAIGASTGGTEAIRKIITKFPTNTPGIVIVQHMPAGFTKTWSLRMNELCEMEVKEAEDNDRIFQGRILIAPGGYHMRVFRSGGEYRVSINPGAPVNGHCPSVNVLFESVAQFVGANAVGAILTGMGADGAEGLLAMKLAGARTIAQDEDTSIVFGMPREAIRIGAVDRVMPLQRIAEEIVTVLSETYK